jgi:hypothetical protein
VFHTNPTADSKPVAIQLVTSSETLKMVPDEDAVCLIDAPLPMELHEYRQFTYKRFTVNAHKCFSVCFTVSRNLLVME